MKYKLYFIVCLAGLCAAASAQIEDSSSDFQAFLEQIRVNNLMRLSDQGVIPNNQQWAMIFGYALKRQAESLGNYEADKARLNRLMEDVKEFLTTLSTDTDLWSITLESYIGRHDEEVLRLMGGLFKYVPVFNSVGEKSQEDENLQQDFESHPDRALILGLAEKMLTHWRNREYQSMISMCAGRLVQESTEAIAQMESDPEAKAKMDEIAAALEWSFISSRVLGDNPPRVSLIYNVKSELNAWHHYEFVFLKDAGTWKIVKFDEVD